MRDFPHPGTPAFDDRVEPFDLTGFFAGELEALGSFHDRFGTLRRQFVATIHGHRQGPSLILDEVFHFDDGELEDRRWTLTDQGGGLWTGTADGVIGTAQGQVIGRSFRLRYRFNLRLGNRFLPVTFDDWMFRQSADLVLNRASVSKFGIVLGTMTNCFRQTVPVREQALLRSA